MFHFLAAAFIDLVINKLLPSDFGHQDSNLHWE
jgi:hypothetical protein